MRIVAAFLVYVAVASAAAVLLGMDAGGLSPELALTSLILGAGAGAAAFGMVTTPLEPVLRRSGLPYFRNAGFYLTAFFFALFALRSFCWLLFYDGDEMKVQSANNLGDLALHLTYIKTFANGVALWPDSPLYVFSKLRYPAGIDLYNGLLTCLGLDLRQQLAATGLIASAATFYALYRWGGAFAVAAFLFNGGVVGFKFFSREHFERFLDYQGASNISWKSIALSMFVTQRGLLYAIPAGLLLLWNWRMRFGGDPNDEKQRLPAWVEYLLYATLPLFHIHTFIALSLTLVVFFVARPKSRLPLVQLVAGALLPATFFVWLTTDNFHAKSILSWHPGWTQTSDEFAMPFFEFWFVNFGIFLPLVIALMTIVIYEERESFRRQDFELSIDLTLLSASTIIFLLVYFVETAPWQWDNIKILIWAYFLVLPVLWRRFLSRSWLIIRAGVCFLLFFSGFVSLMGGLSVEREGHNFASRDEVDLVANAVRSLPVEARFAAFPTYNHPLLLNGRKLVCGYPGHLWTQGINYDATIAQLQSLMLGQGNWAQTAHQLQARYLFWGPEETANYATSTRPWETSRPLIAKGPWGAIYDLGR